ncbi:MULTISPECIES: hypothetical protein [unclassified Yoonia]|uniref:hypothetical protein n=1 Tax=unclassified Yoonia TaxID=2629118 RepID=UPI002AFEE437|nr:MULTISPECIES: hypothetical protein [unclassified Yoonia]
MAGIGHNSGRSPEPGHSWRVHAWTKARRDLLPVLPIEVVRLRVKRAAELGLPYKTYAGIRASNGHDLIGFLFSNNALRVLRDVQDMPAERKARLDGLVKTARHALAHRPVTPTHLAAQPSIDRAFAAPRFTDSWSAMRAELQEITSNLRQPGDRFVLVGDTDFEREWVAAARLAGYVSAEAFFS